jgi:hypothetical protein
MSLNDTTRPSCETLQKPSDTGRPLTWVRDTLSGTISVSSTISDVSIEENSSRFTVNSDGLRRPRSLIPG